MFDRYNCIYIFRLEDDHFNTACAFMAAGDVIDLCSDGETDARTPVKRTASDAKTGNSKVVTPTHLGGGLARFRESLKLQKNGSESNRAFGDVRKQGHRTLSSSSGSGSARLVLGHRRPFAPAASIKTITTLSDGPASSTFAFSRAEGARTSVDGNSASASDRKPSASLDSAVNKSAPRSSLSAAALGSPNARLGDKRPLAGANPLPLAKRQMLDIQGHGIASSSGYATSAAPPAAKACVASWQSDKPKTAASVAGTVDLTHSPGRPWMVSKENSQLIEIATDEEGDAPNEVRKAPRPFRDGPIISNDLAGQGKYVSKLSGTPACRAFAGDGEGVQTLAARPETSPSRSVQPTQPAWADAGPVNKSNLEHVSDGKQSIERITTSVPAVGTDAAAGDTDITDAELQESAMQQSLSREGSASHPAAHAKQGATQRGKKSTESSIEQARKVNDRPGAAHGETTAAESDRIDSAHSEEEGFSRPPSVAPGGSTTQRGGLGKDTDTTREDASEGSGHALETFSIQSDAEKAPGHVETATSASASATSRYQASAVAIDALPLPKRVEKILGKHLQELRDDNEYWTKTQLGRARLSITPASPVLSSSGSTNPFSFRTMKPLQHHPHPGTKSSSNMAEAQVEKHPGQKASVRNTLCCPIICFTTPVDMPGYTHYVSVKTNFLGTNNKILHCQPYFSDEYNFADSAAIEEAFKLDCRDRPRKLLRMLQAQKLDRYVECALKDLEISWADVLRFLLEVNPNVGQNRDVVGIKIRRHKISDEDFSRSGLRTATVLSSLAASTPDRLAKAAILCDAFRTLVKLPLWHVARRHMFDAVPSVAKSQELLDAHTCRVCLRILCHYHGDVRESEEDGEEVPENAPENASDDVTKTDIIHPPSVNWRWRVKFNSNAERRRALGQDARPKLSNKGLRKSPSYWKEPEYILSPNKVQQFYPCDHPGTSCKEAQCSCHELKIPCEKSCTCPSSCTRKFVGCSCRSDARRKGHLGACYEDERCACFALHRECDPDLCGECGVLDVLNPSNRHDDRLLRDKCCNASIQRSAPKHTLIGDSGIHGLGLYAAEDIRPHDFVGEYKGEIVTYDESERRGTVYAEHKLSYLFDINQNQTIDSANFGNKIRFINHSEKHDNLYPRVSSVASVHRVALYARHMIRRGEELLFDYGPTFNWESEDKQKKSTMRKERMTKALEKGYVEFEMERDGMGNLRATKIVAGKGRGGKKKDATTAERKSGNIVQGDVEMDDVNGEEEAPPEDEEAEEGDYRQTAGDRLLAFNIADDGASEAAFEMDPVDDVDFEPEDDEGGVIGDSVSEEENESANGRAFRARAKRTSSSRSLRQQSRE